jgi:hypothetical protein
MTFIGFDSIVFVMISFRALGWVNGAPTPAPTCQSCKKWTKDFIDCNTYVALASANNRILGGTTQKSILQSRNATNHPISLETIFHVEDIVDGNSVYKIYQKFGRSDEFLSVMVSDSESKTGRLTVRLTVQGNLSRDNATRFYVHPENSNLGTQFLCAKGDLTGTNTDYLVSHAEGDGMKMENGECDGWEQFNGAITSKDLQKDKYRFRMLVVMHDNGKKYLSKELRHLCCIDNEPCKACFNELRKTDDA